MDHLKPAFIFPFEVWRRYIRASAKFKVVVSYRRRSENFFPLSKSLIDSKTVRDTIANQLGECLNRYFGGLTQHKVQEIQKDFIRIDCIDCKGKGRKSVCDAHLGVIVGFMEACFYTYYEYRTLTENNICHILLKESYKQ